MPLIHFGHYMALHCGVGKLVNFLLYFKANDSLKTGPADLLTYPGRRWMYDGSYYRWWIAVWAGLV